MTRHTFATTITLTSGVPVETVSNMLGHSILHKQADIYTIEVIDDKNNRRANLIQMK